MTLWLKNPLRIVLLAEKCSVDGAKLPLRTTNADLGVAISKIMLNRSARAGQDVK